MKFGTTNQSAEWDPLADVYPMKTGDGIVDIFDMSLVGQNYGRKIL
jgi:hypothetical protein